jgi:hypothetical protein
MDDKNYEARLAALEKNQAELLELIRALIGLQTNSVKINQEGILAAFSILSSGQNIQHALCRIVVSNPELGDAHARQVIIDAIAQSETASDRLAAMIADAQAKIKQVSKPLLPPLPESEPPAHDS